MNILSLFDGISCWRIALERQWIPVEKYYVSEVDKYSIKVSQHNYKDNIYLWDATKRKDRDIDFSSIDILFAGFPCQARSRAGKMKGIDDERWKLMYTMIEIMDHIQSLNKDIIFLFENVRMNNDLLALVNKEIWSEPISINSNLVSAQNRKRLYRTNIWVYNLPTNKKISIQDIIVGTGKKKIRQRARWFNKWWDHYEKSPTITSWYYYNHKVFTSWYWRRVSLKEMEVLQTIPIWYTNAPGISKSQKLKMIWNARTVDVISHILSFVPK